MAHVDDTDGPKKVSIYSASLKNHEFLVEKHQQKVANMKERVQEKTWAQ